MATNYTKYPKKITASDMTEHTVAPPAIPEAPAKGSSDATYLLKVSSTGEVTWVAHS